MERQTPKKVVVSKTAAERLRIALQTYIGHTVPALNIDDYADKIYQVNRGRYEE